MRQKNNQIFIYWPYFQKYTNGYTNPYGISFSYFCGQRLQKTYHFKLLERFLNQARNKAIIIDLKYFKGEGLNILGKNFPMTQ